MPHVVLTGDIKLKDVFDRMTPITLRNDDVILRTLKNYIDNEESSILMEALVIEQGKRTGFLALLSSREDGLVVRIYPGSNVEKTDGVKRVLAEVAKQLMSIFPSLTVGKTNLQEFL